ncbi:MAG: hypothetical protein RMN25_11100 [Anaerolineae bacterium]|nr:hypothetical protein [Thermoflexales bacterium]MDW8408315.1 hypothetical protein [Anaerolineae bacterium]
MNKTHLQYFVISTIATAVGATLLAGWGNLIAAGGVGILGGRRVAKSLTDPRLGKVAGAAIGLWIGAGAVVGQVLASVIAAATTNAQITFGVVILLGLVGFFVAWFAATIAGRENVQPPEEEA